MSARGLTPKQARFVEEYLIDFNGSAAYQRAGYKGTGNTAEVNASKLLRTAKVQEAIQQARQAQTQRTEITADYVLKGLKAEAERMGQGTSHSARVRAHELLGKHLGMFPDRHEHSGPGGTPLPPIQTVEIGRASANGRPESNGVH